MVWSTRENSVHGIAWKDKKVKVALYFWFCIFSLWPKVSRHLAIRLILFILKDSDSVLLLTNSLFFFFFFIHSRCF